VCFEKVDEMKGLSESSAIEEAMLLAHTHLDSIRIQSDHLNSVVDFEPRVKWNLPSKSKANSNVVQRASSSNTVVRGTPAASPEDDPELHRFRRRMA
jgi:hypothetical protein